MANSRAESRRFVMQHLMEESLIDRETAEIIVDLGLYASEVAAEAIARVCSSHPNSTIVSLASIVAMQYLRANIDVVLKTLALMKTIPDISQEQAEAMVLEEEERAHHSKTI